MKENFTNKALKTLRTVLIAIIATPTVFERCNNFENPTNPAEIGFRGTLNKLISNNHV